MQKWLTLVVCLLVSAYAGAHTVTLHWTQSGSDDVVSNKLYCGHQSGGPYPYHRTSKHPVTGFTKLNAPSGTYYCVVTAINSWGEESKASNEVRFIVPN